MMAAPLLRPAVRLIGRGLRADRPVEEQRAHVRRQMELMPRPGRVAYADREVGDVPAIKATPSQDVMGRGVLYLHGGGFGIGTAESYAGFGGRLARATRATTWILDYRLAPEHPYPAPLDDVRAAYAALVDDLGPREMVVVGDSAGGGLALSLLHALRDEGGPLPAGAVLISPWLDLTCSGESITSRAEADPMLTPEWLASMAANHAGGRDLASISPLFADHEGLPPLQLFAGTDEVLLSDAVRLADRARHADVDVELVVEQGMWHVYPLLAPVLPEAARALDAVGRFAQTRTGERRP